MIGLAVLAAAIAAPQPVLTIDPKHRIVEGVASDGTTVWVSSLLDRQILACKTTCRVMARIPAPLHPFGIAWDAGQSRLWVAADCPPGVPAIKPCERGALIALDVRGRIQTRIAPAVGPFHPGDVSASPAGVFVSDSQSGAVYFAARKTSRLIPAIKPGVGKSGQGMALSEDGKQLLIADYSQGVGAVNMVSGARTIMMRPDGKPLRGIDGLTRCGVTYYGLYNGAAPGSLVAIMPTTTGLAFEQLATFPDPTQIAFDGKRLLIVADSGWATLDKPDFKRTEGTPIVAVPLSEDCRPL